MKSALDKNFGKFSSRQTSGETSARFTAAQHVQGLKLLERLNDMARIEHYSDSIKLSVNHPYFRTTPEERQRVLAIVDAQLELLRAIWPKRKGAGLIPAPNNTSPP